MIYKIFFQKFQLCLRILELQIQIVQLNLTKLHLFAVLFQKSSHYRSFSVSRKSQMFNSSIFLLEEIFEKQLEKCRADHFDFYLFHNVCEMNIDAYLNLKAQDTAVSSGRSAANFAISSSVRFASLPPRRGSITHTGISYSFKSSKG